MHPVGSHAHAQASPDSSAAAALQGASLAFSHQKSKSTSSPAPPRTHNGGALAAAAATSTGGHHHSRNTSRVRSQQPLNAQYTGGSVLSDTDDAGHRAASTMAARLSTSSSAGALGHHHLHPGTAAGTAGAPVDSKSASFIAATLAASRSASPSPKARTPQVAPLAAHDPVLPEAVDSESIAPTGSLISLFERSRAHGRDEDKHGSLDSESRARARTAAVKAHPARTHTPRPSADLREIHGHDSAMSDSSHAPHTGGLQVEPPAHSTHRRKSAESEEHHGVGTSIHRSPSATREHARPTAPALDTKPGPPHDLHPPPMSDTSPTGSQPTTKTHHQAKPYTEPRPRQPSSPEPARQRPIRNTSPLADRKGPVPNSSPQRASPVKSARSVVTEVTPTKEKPKPRPKPKPQRVSSIKVRHERSSLDQDASQQLQSAGADANAKPVHRDTVRERAGMAPSNEGPSPDATKLSISPKKPQTPSTSPSPVVRRSSPPLVSPQPIRLNKPMLQPQTPEQSASSDLRLVLSPPSGDPQKKASHTKRPPTPPKPRNSSKTAASPASRVESVPSKQARGESQSKRPGVQPRNDTADSASSDDTFVSASSVQSPPRLSPPTLPRRRGSAVSTSGSPSRIMPRTHFKNSSTSNIPLNSLTSAIVAGSLASSRLTPQHTGSSLPPPAPPRRQKSPRLHQTLRQPATGSDDETDRHKRGHHHHHSHYRSKLHGTKHTHHEGSRKRWRDEITQRERKRYESVWASNRGLHVIVPANANESGSGSGTSPERGGDRADYVSNIVVREIWRRSRLPLDELAEVWDLVDRRRGAGVLSRPEFVVGMWLIDQRLRGRKIPHKVSDSVWGSANGLRVKKPKMK